MLKNLSLGHHIFSTRWHTLPMKCHRLLWRQGVSIYTLVSPSWGPVFSRPCTSPLSPPQFFIAATFFIESHHKLDRLLRNGVVLRAFSSVHRAIVHRGIIYRRRMTKHNLHRRLRVAKWAAVWSIVRVAVNVDSRVFYCVQVCVWICVHSRCVSPCNACIHDSQEHSCMNNPGSPIPKAWRVKSWRRGFSRKLGMWFCDSS